MRTNACPHCSEVIPSDVDYCPFCGQSTQVSLQNDDDQLVATRSAERMAAAQTRPTSDFEKLPPVNRISMCVLCYVEPASNGDYCEVCNEKLNLRPDEWDALNRQKAIRSWAIIGFLAILILIALVLALTHQHHRRMSDLPSTISGPRIVSISRSTAVLTSPLGLPIMR